MPALRNLVFDLGGVLYAIDGEQTTQALFGFRPHSPSPAEIDQMLAQGQPLFDAFEMGLMSLPEFREQLNALVGIEVDAHSLDQAWNALLLGVIPGRVDDLRNLQEKYRLILLSNTNLIHQTALRDECKDLFACFEHCFFSYDMGLRKPDPAIYKTALERMDMAAAESLFIDDRLENVEGAKLAGMQGHYFEVDALEAWAELMARLR